MKHFKISLVGSLVARLLSNALYSCIKEGLSPSSISNAMVVKQINAFKLFDDVIDIPG